MKRTGFSLLLTAIVAVLALSMSSCDQNGLCVTPTGETMEQTLDLGAINGFHITGEASVFVQEGAEQSVVIKAQQAMLDALDFSVTNGILITDLDGCFTRGKMEVFVTVAKPITEIAVSGSGDLINTSDLRYADFVKLDVSGAGTLEISNIETSSIEVSVAGSGDITLSGNTEKLAAQVSGSGDIMAYDLTASSIDASVSGSGTLKVNADNATLTATVSGSGDVYYKGTPSELTVRISGSGDVEQDD